MIRPPAQRRRGLSWQMLVLIVAVIVALVAVFAIVRTDPPERSTPLQISTSEWLPYISPDLPNNGPVAEMLTEVFGRAGYTPEFQFSTWPLAEREVTSGASIGMAPVVVSDARSSFALYTDSLLDFRYTLFGRTGKQLDSVSRRPDLQGLRIARIDGYQYWDELENSGATFSDYPSALAAFTAVAKGDADLVAEGSIAGRNVLTSAEFQDDAARYAEVTPKTAMTSSTQGLHLLIKDTPEGRRLQREFNRALAEFRGTEDYENLVAALTDSSAPVVLSSAGGGAVEVMDKGGKVVGATPSGTKAMVAQWPSATPERRTPVKVKLLDGPMAGRILTVRMDDVEITDA